MSTVVEFIGGPWDGKRFELEGPPRRTFKVALGPLPPSLFGENAFDTLVHLREHEYRWHCGAYISEDVRP